MRLLDDERGQSVQVGAAILLGFVVIAITMYQVQVVSSQNAEVEFNHNQEVRQDMTELRNSISNAGSGGSSDSVSVQLGTQYPPRTIFVNPPPVHGQVRTERAGNISFGDAMVARDDYGGDAQALLDDDHPTSRIVYAPRYSEFDNAGVTTLEHSLAFNTFENNATNSLTPQQIVQNDSLQLTVLRGNLSEQGTGSVSIDPRTVSGPTDPIRIRNDSGGPVVIHLPTETPDAWNETLGTESGSNGAQVSGYDGERVRVELQQSEYELRMALVGVGSRVSNPGTYDVHAASTSNNGSDSAYQIRWSDVQSDSSVSDCDASGCQEDYQVVVGTQSADFTAETVPGGITGADADFSLRDPDGVGVTEGGTKGSQTSGGSATLELEDFDNTGVVQAYVSSGGSSDEISIGVVGGLLPTITATNSPVEGGEQLTVTTDVENTADQQETQNVELEISGVGVVDSQSVTVGAGGTESVTLTWQTSQNDTGEYDAIVRTSDSSDSSSVAVQEDTVPPNAVAYADENGDGNYDDGEQTYVSGDLSGISTSNDVYVVRNASPGSIDIQGSAIFVEPGVRLASQGQASFQSSTDEVRIAGTITTPQGQDLSISSAGPTNLTDGTLRAQSAVTIQSSGAFYGDRSTIDVQVSYASVTIDGDGPATFRNAMVTGGAEYQVTFGDDVDMSGMTVQSEASYASMSLTSRGDLTADDGTISAGNDLTVTTSGDMSLRNARVESRNGRGSMLGQLNDPSNTLFVEGTEFRSGGSDGTFSYTPEGVDVDGEPDQGTTALN